MNEPRSPQTPQQAARRAFLVIGVATLVSLVALVFTQGSSLTVLSRDGRRALAIISLNDQDFVALDDLAAMFQLVVAEDALGAITVTYKGRTIVLTPDQALASVAGRLVSLPAAPVRGSAPGRRWLVPVEFVSRALAPIYDTPLELRKPSRLLIVGDLRVPRVVVRYEAIGPAGRLTVDASPRATSTVAQDNDHLTIRFDADAVDLATPPVQVAPQPLVQAIRLVDPVTIGVDLAPRFGGFKASSQPLENAMRVVIDLVAVQAENVQPPAPPAAPPVDLTALNPPVSSVRTITIDPGHGGDDEGARGGNGTREKDITLSVARRIKALIESRLGVRVLLTRDEDRNVPLDERTAIANNNKADIFISLHANASFRKSLAGAAVFSAAFAPDAEHAARLALTPERLPTFGGGLRDIELVPWDVAQFPHLDRSKELAAIVEQQLRSRVALAPRPLDAGPLRVLESANMPAVLVEIGYLTNANQEKQLAAAEFQNTFAQALYDAVIRFRDALDGAAAPSRVER